jgi:signal transduction histidine kinase
VSHELRTPIAALRTFTELLQGKAGEKPDTRAEFLESSAVQLERLDWLAQNLLELSKLDSGLVLLDLRPDDIRATVESAVEQAEPTAAKRGVRLELQLPDAPLRIRHDPPRVGQIITNLVGNALKFTERGGRVRVVVRPAPDGAAELEVSDTGVGIDAAELPRIFERFYRGSRMHEVRSTGSGLGLAIVKSIVDMHGGTIAVESRVGEGSTFVVTLPRDPREAIDAVPGASATPAAPTPRVPEPAAPTAVAPIRSTWARPADEAQIPKMVDSSPGDAPGLNP